jgi:hypothetical protein
MLNEFQLYFTHLTYLKSKESPVINVSLEIMLEKLTLHKKSTPCDHV